MQYEINWIDVNPYLQHQVQPVFLLQRPLLHGDTPKAGLFNNSEVARVGEYVVPVSDLTKDEVEYSLVKSGEYVRIPVFAYRTSSRALSALVGAAIQYGITARNGLRYSSDQIESVTLVLGHEVHDLLQEGFRSYVGMAFKLKG